MFKIVQTTSYKWPVEFKIPTDGGRFANHSFDAEFKRLTRDEVEALRNRFTDPDTNVADLAREIVVGWDGVSDDSGAIPFSVSALNRVLEIQGVAPAIVGSFLASCYGVERKN